MSDPSTPVQGRSVFRFSGNTLSYPLICIVGPTASGKTALAQELAQRLDGEVVGADSMQVYRGMDIGTGKIPAEERLVPHHCIDICDPGDPYSAALYQRDARAAFMDIEARGKRIILCGGTGLYIRAAVDEYEFPRGGQVGNSARERYTLLAEEQGAQALWEMLYSHDPESAALIHPNNIRRVVRALELWEEGRSYADQHRNLAFVNQAFPAFFIGLEADPPKLSERIDRRVDDMVHAGLVEEVERLVQRGFRRSITAPQAIGYKEIVSALDGDITLDEAISQIKASTRRYAKRQRTWFKKDTRIIWMDVDMQDNNDLPERALGLIEGKG